MRGLRNVRPTFDSHAGKYAEDNYNTLGSCKRPAGTSVAIEEMDWSSMTEDYVCFTETFDANAELSDFCDDVVSDAASINSGNDKDSDDNSLTVILCVVIGALLVVIAILVIMKLRKPTKPPSEAAPPVREPTAPIKAEAFRMMLEEQPQAAEPIAEAMPHGHISGAEAAAMMAEGEPPPQPSEGWGRRFAAWRAGESAEVLAVDEEPPPAPAMTGYPPEAEFEPEC